jgi:hypothetical protein
MRRAAEDDTDIHREGAKVTKELRRMRSGGIL